MGRSEIKYGRISTLGGISFHLWEFYQITPYVQLGTKMNLLDFEVKRSKVKVTMKLNMIKNHLLVMDRSGEGIPVDSSPSKTI